MSGLLHPNGTRSWDEAHRALIGSRAAVKIFRCSRVFVPSGRPLVEQLLPSAGIRGWHEPLGLKIPSEAVAFVDTLFKPLNCGTNSTGIMLLDRFTS